MLRCGADGVHATTEFIDDVDLMGKTTGRWLWERVDVEGKVLASICSRGTEGGWGWWCGEVASYAPRARTTEEAV